MNLSDNKFQLTISNAKVYAFLFCALMFNLMYSCTIFTCEIEFINELELPCDNLKIIVFKVECGATTEGSYQISQVTSDFKITPESRGNIFITNDQNFDPYIDIRFDSTSGVLLLAEKDTTKTFLKDFSNACIDISVDNSLTVRPNLPIEIESALSFHISHWMVDRPEVKECNAGYLSIYNGERYEFKIGYNCPDQFITHHTVIYDTGIEKLLIYDPISDNYKMLKNENIDTSSLSNRLFIPSLSSLLVSIATNKYSWTSSRYVGTDDFAIGEYKQLGNYSFHVSRKTNTLELIVAFANSYDTWKSDQDGQIIRQLILKDKGFQLWNGLEVGQNINTYSHLKFETRTNDSAIFHEVDIIESFQKLSYELDLRDGIITKITVSVEN